MCYLGEAYTPPPSNHDTYSIMEGLLWETLNIFFEIILLINHQYIQMILKIWVTPC